jgi:cysteinyl-tRNA synthetase
MAIRIYDTRARRNVELDVRDSGRVSMYGCGMTVYGYAHIGNARTVLWYDQIRRYLEYRGFAVTYVMNYTDVDDKIIERAKLEKATAEEIAHKYSVAFEKDMTALGVAPPTILCRATDHIEDMIKSIEGLIERGAAYEAEGDVYFSVETFRSYGKLSHRSLDDIRAMERIEPSDKKRHPVDFALWKAAKEGEPSWESPWGPGRPGWHIECSVMATKYLGMDFDIHSGATDLIFPHHENEIAQAEALDARGRAFVRHWMHAGLVQMETEKMSKSLGNIVLVKDLLESYPGEVVRYWALTSSYRSQAVFSDDSLEDARQAYERLNNFHTAARHLLGDEFPAPESARRRINDASVEGPGAELVVRFIEAMDDDFNSARALAAVHDLVRSGNKLIEGAQRGDSGRRAELKDLTGRFVELTDVLGLHFLADEPAAGLAGGLIDFLLELREEARADKAFDRADAIRSKLQELGVSVEDTPAGPRWRLPG